MGEIKTRPKYPSELPWRNPDAEAARHSPAVQAKERELIAAMTPLADMYHEKNALQFRVAGGVCVRVVVSGEVTAPVLRSIAGLLCANADVLEEPQ